MCGIKRGQGCKGDTWCWNTEVREAISRRRKKDVHKVMCRNSTVNDRNRCKTIKEIKQFHRH